jgi:hypothetical protein
MFLTSKFGYFPFCNPTHKTETGFRWETTSLRALRKCRSKTIFLTQTARTLPLVVYLSRKYVAINRLGSWTSTGPGTSAPLTRRGSWPPSEPCSQAQGNEHLVQRAGLLLEKENSFNSELRVHKSTVPGGSRERKINRKRPEASEGWSPGSLLTITHFHSILS